MAQKESTHKADLLDEKGKYGPVLSKFNLQQGTSVGAFPEYFDDWFCLNKQQEDSSGLSKHPLWYKTHNLHYRSHICHLYESVLNYAMEQVSAERRQEGTDSNNDTNNVYHSTSTFRYNWLSTNIDNIGRFKKDLVKTFSKNHLLFPQILLDTEAQLLSVYEVDDANHPVAEKNRITLGTFLSHQRVKSMSPLTQKVIGLIWLRDLLRGVHFIHSATSQPDTYTNLGLLQVLTWHQILLNPNTFSLSLIWLAEDASGYMNDKIFSLRTGQNPTTEQQQKVVLFALLGHCLCLLTGFDGDQTIRVNKTDPKRKDAITARKSLIEPVLNSLEDSLLRDLSIDENDIGVRDAVHRFVNEWKALLEFTTTDSNIVSALETLTELQSVLHRLCEVLNIDSDDNDPRLVWLRNQKREIVDSEKETIMMQFIDEIAAIWSEKRETERVKQSMTERVMEGVKDLSLSPPSPPPLPRTQPNQDDNCHIDIEHGLSSLYDALNMLNLSMYHRVFVSPIQRLEQYYEGFLRYYIPGSFCDCTIHVNNEDDSPSGTKRKRQYVEFRFIKKSFSDKPLFSRMTNTLSHYLSSSHSPITIEQINPIGEKVVVNPDTLPYYNLNLSGHLVPLVTEIVSESSALTLRRQTIGWMQMSLMAGFDYSLLPNRDSPSVRVSEELLWKSLRYGFDTSVRKYFLDINSYFILINCLVYLANDFLSIYSANSEGKDQEDVKPVYEDANASNEDVVEDDEEGDGSDIVVPTIQSTATKLNKLRYIESILYHSLESLPRFQQMQQQRSVQEVQEVSKNDRNNVLMMSMVCVSLDVLIYVFKLLNVFLPLCTVEEKKFQLLSLTRWLCTQRNVFDGIENYLSLCCSSLYIDKVQYCRAMYDNLFKLQM